MCPRVIYSLLIGLLSASAFAQSGGGVFVPGHVFVSEIGTEGCLSIPGFVGDVERPLEAVIKGFDRRGKPIRIKAKGWLARIFQHEIDHLDGILFTDRAEKVWAIREQDTQAIAAD